MPPAAVGFAVAALDGRLELHSPGGGRRRMRVKTPL
jgi:hypothetical protein